MTENDDHTFDWELNRENIQPLRKGRHASAVTSLGSRPMSASARAAQAEEKMNQVLSIFQESNENVDLLSEVLSFISWFENHIMIGKQKLLYEFLWKCVTKLTTDERYKNDERILKVWIKLAENSLGNDCNIFDHANSTGSLKRMAQFYVEWSMACESRSQWAEARRCLERGIKSAAAPISVLHDAADQLEMRIIRRETQQSEVDNEEELEDESNENGERRVAFTRLAQMDMGAAPIVRLPSISGCEGSSKIGPTSTKKKQENTKFEIYTDDKEDDSSTWLESVYEIRSQITKMDIVDDNTNTTCKISLTAGTKRNVAPSFTIWEEGKEEEKKKPRLMLRKELIRDMSIEESLVERYSVLFETISPHQENRPKNLHLCKADIKPLLFD